MRQPWFVRGDLDGFFGLAVDNLVQILLIVALTRGLLHFPDALVFGRILPGIAMSLLVGNFYYGWQARVLAARTGREDVTALPFGINTPSIFAYVFLVMLPVWIGSSDLPTAERAERAWQAGLTACFLSGIIEAAGALVGERIRKHTPRAALLSALSGIALAFIAMDFLFRIYAHPLVGLIGFGFVLGHYMSGRSLPFGIPAGLLAVLLGTFAAWIFKDPTLPVISIPWGFALPESSLTALLAGFGLPGLGSAWTVILSMGLLNVLGTLQNIESAEAAGDAYPVPATMLINGLATGVAACFGSCFPTTVYIGHPGWKAMGARSGYSIANGLFWAAVILPGFAPLLARSVPVEAGAGIVVWIAIVITAQAFQATPARHAPAIALGFFPALAAWGVVIVTGALRAVDIIPDAKNLSRIDGSGAFVISGALHLWAGFLFTSTLWAALGCDLIDRKFKAAAGWATLAAVLSCFGLIHGVRITPVGPVETLALGAAGWEIPASYAVIALVFLLQGRRAA